MNTNTANTNQLSGPEMLPVLSRNRLQDQWSKITRIMVDQMNRWIILWSVEGLTCLSINNRTTFFCEKSKMKFSGSGCLFFGEHTQKLLSYISYSYSFSSSKLKLSIDTWNWTLTLNLWIKIQLKRSVSFWSMPHTAPVPNTLRDVSDIIDFQNFPMRVTGSLWVPSVTSEEKNRFESYIFQAF